MRAFSLEEIVTNDGLVHQGIFFRPSQKASNRAILWIHGLCGKFYGGVLMLEKIVSMCEETGIGMASFNSRGHDIAVSMHKKDSTKPSGYSYVTGGSGYEVFEECVHDIDAAVSFLVQQGFSEVILAGSSSGANKACYYAATVKDPRIAGVILLGPMSDRYSSGYTQEVYEKYKNVMQKKISEGKGDMLLDGYDFFALTPRRWISLYVAGSKEDVFNYDDGDKALMAYSHIAIPLLILIGQNDEHAHIPVVEIQKQFDARAQSSHYQSVLIDGADHGFNGKEQEVLQAITSWMSSF
jgi:alpha-beta hydrolase superfamily lysophospholipase